MDLTDEVQLRCLACSRLDDEIVTHTAAAISSLLVVVVGE